jgi:PPOX class probable F420-dependent enzyme
MGEKIDTRKSIRMTPAEATAFLQKTPNCSLATLDREGYPHLVAMSFAVDDNGDILMTSFGRAQKVVNLRRDPKTAVMVEHGLDYDKLKGVMIRGRATIVEDFAAVLDAMALVSGKMARLAGRPTVNGRVPVSESYKSQAAKRVVIRIRPEKWASWDHAKIAPAAR